MCSLVLKDIASDKIHLYIRWNDLDTSELKSAKDSPGSFKRGNYLTRILIFHWHFLLQALETSIQYFMVLEDAG